FLRGLIKLALGEEKAFRPLEVLLAPCPAFCAAFYACHGFAPLAESELADAGIPKNRGAKDAKARRYRNRISANQICGSKRLRVRGFREYEACAAQRVCSGGATKALPVNWVRYIGRQAPVKRCLARIAAQRISQAACRTVSCSAFFAKRMLR